MEKGWGFLLLFLEAICLVYLPTYYMPMAYSSKVTGFCLFNGSNFQLLHKDICGLSKVLKLDFPFNFPFFFLPTLSALDNA